MSKRYSGKSFKDSSVNKKPKLSLKEKRRLKKEKAKKNKITTYFSQNPNIYLAFLKFSKKIFNI